MVSFPNIKKNLKYGPGVIVKAYLLDQLLRK
jgi:hypothetical protein